MATAEPLPVVDAAVEESRRFWATRRLPPESGILGPADGALVRQFEGTFVAGDPPTPIVQRAVLADVDARYLALTGRRVVGSLRRENTPAGDSGTAVPQLLERLAVWTGGPQGQGWETTNRHDGVQAMLARLARRGVVAARDAPLRVCLSCAAPRSPERIVYQQEIGDTLLVRFPLSGPAPAPDALVWVDAPWRLLGTSALLVNPDVPYVVIDFRRKEATATLLTSRSSLERLRAWLPEIELTVREEHVGRDLVGRAYAYPLRHEFPMGGTLTPPAGTIQAVADVGDTGTGIVPLVPGHGGTDAQIAERLGITGWPLLTVSGVFDLTLMHKYAGLDLETANEFVTRDLTEGGSVFARLRVMRGVPYCGVCGHSMVWIPSRAWCLEPNRLPAEESERYSRLLPRDRPIAQIEVAPWAVSETVTSQAPDAFTLLECSRCARLDGPDGPAACPCGGRRRPVSRRLVPSLVGTFSAWAGASDLAPTDQVRIYANDRRRSPVLVHHLVALAGLEREVRDVSLTVLPSIPELDVAQLLERFGPDAVRGAIVRAAVNEGRTGGFPEGCRQEAGRFAQLRAAADDLWARCDPALRAAIAQPIESGLRELEIEDRAVLARWARAHLQVAASYDRRAPGIAQRELFRFVERDLEEYREIARPRLQSEGSSPTRRAAVRTLGYLLRSIAVDLAPIAPYFGEAARRRLTGDARSVFEGVDLSADRRLVDDGLSAAWDRWRLVLRAVEGFRRQHKIPAGTLLPSLVLVLPGDDLAGRLRSERAVLERVAGVRKVEVASPQNPWDGLQRRLVPIDSEIQKAYPALAPQIVHLLHRLPPRKLGESGGKELTVFVHGVPRAISPSMVRAVETLPDRFVPAPFALGQMYIELPNVEASEATAPPPLSPDAFWLVRRTRQRLTRTPGSATPTRRIALAMAVDPLASELREKAGPIARYLGLDELRVIDRPEGAALPSRVTGRTRTGARWWVHLPGLSLPRRTPKRRPSGVRGRRLPVVRDGASEPTDAIDWGDPAVAARAQSIRELGQELDTLLAAPVLGPTKLAYAWDAGYHSVADFSRGPFDSLAAIPGFGRPIAAALWTKLGRAPPPAPARRRPTPASSPLARSTPIRLVASPRTGSERSQEALVSSATSLSGAPPDAARPVGGDDASPEGEALPMEPTEIALASPRTTLAELARPNATPSVRDSPGSGDVSVSESPGPTAAIPLEGGGPSAETPAADPEPEAPAGESAPGSPPEPPVVGEAIPEGSPAPDSTGQVPPEAIEPSDAESNEPEGATGGELTPPPASPGTDENGPTERPGPSGEEGAPIPTEPTGISPVLPSLSDEEPPGSAPPEPAERNVSPDPAPPLTPPAAEEPPGPSLREAAPAGGEAPVVGNESSDGARLPITPPTPPIPEAEGTAVAPPAAEETPGLSPGPTPEALEPCAEERAPAAEEPVVLEAAPVPVTLPEPLPPPPSGLEFDTSESLLQALQPFLEATAAGHRGIAIVRELPERIRAHVGPRPVEVYWLTNLGRGSTLRPGDLPGISERIRRALEEETVTAFFLEGVEYLVGVHGIDRIVDFLREVDAEARPRLARVWVHLTPGLLAPEKRERLEAAMTDRLPPQDSPGNDSS